MAVLAALLWVTAAALAGVTYHKPVDQIEHAVLTATAGDTIVLEDGLYSESVFIQAKKVTIASRFLIDGDTSHIARTVLQHDTVHPDTQSCFIIVDCSDTVRLVGLTMCNGLGTLWSKQNAYAGGCVYGLRSKVVLEDCVIRSASAVYGGGVFAFRDEAESVNSLSIVRCKISLCASDLWGGGIYSNRCSLQVKDCEFRNCLSLSQSGGGIIAIAPSALIENCLFDSCSGGTGGVSLGSGTAVVRGCRFTNNTATGPTYWAAHLAGGQGNHRIEGNYFGSTLSNTHGLHFCCDTGDSTFFVGNVVELNEATVRTGNLILAGVAGEVSYNFIRYNLSGTGRQLYCFQGTTIDIHHNVFEGNLSSDPDFPSVLLTGPNARQWFHDNIVRGNSGQTIDYFSDYPTMIDARNNWWGDASGPYHPALNPGGFGDTLLSDSVLFDPWLLAPPEISSATIEQLPAISAYWRLLGAYLSPFSSEITVAMVGIMGQSFSLKLYDKFGREVGVIAEGRGHGSMIPYTAPPTLAAGLYFVRAADNQNVETRKIVYLK